ncbi:MAG: D-glycero-beta-D-manno-heptose 1,7-bisphosphate 7-phosphatase [Deltaproteobacteria bacterium]|jgi:D-glycero-D-manno-heptose 1,7-bisphosphate phosphatase|nr:D-glycero-beta-D-manno-heptose 1,7-bisphosphate 7-phosphatase [Deltaproteobacteria bacterium]
MTAPWYVLLDRDGTIIEDRHYLADPDGVTLLPGAVAGLGRLAQAGYRLAIVTNQSGIGRGLFDLDAMHRVHERLAVLLARHDIHLDGIFFCPHAPEEGCDCRKPLPGLFGQAARSLGVRPERACIVGDKEADVDLGRNVGARTLLVRTGHGRDAEARAGNKADAVVDDLAAAADWILARCPPDAAALPEST